MSYEFILTEKHELVRLVRLNRPALRNALDAALIDEPSLVVDAFEADGTVGAIVVTGNDPRGCSWSRRQFSI